jgi:hypothetical protein
VYDVIAEPPSDGAVHVTVTVEPAAEAETLVGAPGAVAALTLEYASAAAATSRPEVPASLFNTPARSRPDVPFNLFKAPTRAKPVVDASTLAALVAVNVGTPPTIVPALMFKALTRVSPAIKISPPYQS